MGSFSGQFASERIEESWIRLDKVIDNPRSVLSILHAFYSETSVFRGGFVTLAAFL